MSCILFNTFIGAIVNKRKISLNNFNNIKEFNYTKRKQKCSLEYEFLN